MTTFPINNAMFMHPRYTPESAWLGHIPFAAWLIEVARPGVLVELGTHRGASYMAFCQAVRDCVAPTRCYAVDTWQGDEHAGSYGDEIYLPLLDYHQRNYADFSRLLRMRFEEAVQYFDDGTVDVLHIDGLHTYEAVRNDFETWKGKLSRRAVVLFHDINVRERGFGVWNYWEEIRKDYPSFAFTHTHGLGVLLVGPEQPGALLTLCQAGIGDEAEVLQNRLFDQLGKLIVANIDIGALAGQVGGLTHQKDRLARENENLAVQQANLQAKMNHQVEIYEQELSRGRELQSSLDAMKMLDYMKNEVEHVRGELQRLQGSLSERGMEIDRLVQTVNQRDIELERMRSSMSWRMMGPLRRMRRMFG